MKTRLPHWTWNAALQARDPGPVPPLDLDRPLPPSIATVRAGIRHDFAGHLAELLDDRAREAFIATATRHRLAGKDHMITAPRG